MSGDRFMGSIPAGAAGIGPPNSTHDLETDD